MTKTLKWIYQTWARALPPRRVKSVVQWAVENKFKLVGSARSETYNPDISPWTKEPLECADNGTRKMTLVLPIQSGKSAVGEIAIGYWISTQNGGDIQYNWQNDKAADDRWMKRVERILKACPSVMARTSPDRFKWTKGLVIFPHLNFIMQGVLSDRNVASDSICRQVNEELHDAAGGWSPGRLEQAHGRLTAFWNSIAFQISNAGYDGDQLHKIKLASTDQHWEVKCPGCGLFHRMRTKWEDDKPHLGGLRYDDCKREDGSYDYFKMQSTIRFQMTCSYPVHEVVTERRALSLSGLYSEGDNTGALRTERSYTMEAVAIDYIPWIELIKQKHSALKSLQYGNPEPWSVYLRERECKFYKKGMQPVIRNIVTSKAKKNRDGLPNRVARFGAGDYQQGSLEAKRPEQRLPHWWALIWDVEILPDGKVHILIVAEELITTDANMVFLFSNHEVMPSAVLLDSSWNSKAVYAICLHHGFSCVKGEDNEFYAGHEDKSRKVYSPPAPLHAMENQPPVYEYIFHQGKHIPNPQEPMFIRYSKFGLMNRVNWLRTSPMVHFEVPEDVSQDFIEHMDAWKLENRVKKGTKETVQQWVQHRDRDDLFMCACYCTLMMEDAGLIGAGVVEEKS